MYFLSIRCSRQDVPLPLSFIHPPLFTRYGGSAEEKGWISFPSAGHEIQCERERREIAPPPGVGRWRQLCTSDRLQTSGLGWKPRGIWGHLRRSPIRFGGETRKYIFFCGIGSIWSVYWPLQIWLHMSIWERKMSKGGLGPLGPEGGPGKRVDLLRQGTFREMNFICVSDRKAMETRAARELQRETERHFRVILIHVN